MKQMLLFPDPRPLVERLGEAFFREAPQGPGVYLMRDGAGQVLYVGKAKNLRQRLNAYRVANPDRLRRRHLRLLRAVTQIEFQACADEGSALARESELIFALKPKFNRAGVWRGPARYLGWRSADGRFEFAVLGQPEKGWRGLGPLGMRAVLLHAVLVRLVWWALHPERGVFGLPSGWLDGDIENPIAIPVAGLTDAIHGFLEKAVVGDKDSLSGWLQARMGEDLHPIERALLEGHLDFLTERGSEMSQVW